MFAGALVVIEMRLSSPVIVVIMMLVACSRAFLAPKSSRLASKCSKSLRMMSESVSYKIGFMFPGQGAQNVGMAGALCEELPEAKELFTKVCSLPLLPF